MTEDIDVLAEAIRDGLASLGRELGNGGASTPMGALEAHGQAVLTAAAAIAAALHDVADAIRGSQE